MYRHLVTIKVGIEGSTNQRMQANGLAFHQYRFKCLNTQPVQGWRTVQHDRVLMNHFGQNIPYFRNTLLDQLFGCLDGIGQAAQFQLVVDKRLEQLQRHLLGQAALMQFQIGTNHNDGTSGIIHALTEQILTETTLLALDDIGQGFQRTPIITGDRLAAAIIIE